MALTEAKRNKYRGLQAFIKANYELNGGDIESLHKSLQDAPRYKGVCLESVRTAWNNLHRKDNPVKVSNGTAPTHNFLVTIPMARRKSLTLTWAEAKKMHSDLCVLFGNK